MNDLPGYDQMLIDQADAHMRASEDHEPGDDGPDPDWIRKDRDADRMEGIY